LLLSKSATLLKNFERHPMGWEWVSADQGLML